MPDGATGPACATLFAVLGRAATSLDWEFRIPFSNSGITTILIRGKMAIPIPRAVWVCLMSGTADGLGWQTSQSQAVDFAAGFMATDCVTGLDGGDCTGVGWKNSDQAIPSHNRNCERSLGSVNQPAGGSCDGTSGMTILIDSFVALTIRGPASF